MKKIHPDSNDPNQYLEKLLEQRTRNLRLTNEELTLLIESIPVIPYECSADRTTGTTYIHKSVEKITGFSPQEFMAAPDFWSERIHPEDRKRILSQLKKLKESDKLSLEYRWQIADGSYKWFSDHLHQFHNKKGEPVYIHGYWQDITEKNTKDERNKTKDEGLKT